MFEIVVTARPGHTAEEMEKAIDEELAAFRKDGPTAVELERARNGVETRNDSRDSSAWAASAAWPTA